MADHTTGFDIAAAARTERSREAREAASARAHATSAMAEAHRLAEQIVTECGADVEEVSLFGSLARGDARSLHADIDLAVRATPEAFLRAVSIALSSSFPVHVVDPRTAAPHFRDAIRRDGVVLYAR